MDNFEQMLSLQDKVLNDKYLFKEQLGSGSQGNVYKAQVLKDFKIIQNIEQKEVAIKIINNRTQKRKEKELLQNEISALNTVSSPYVVQLFEVFEDEDSTYLVFEYCEGQSFDYYLKNRNLQKIPERFVKDIFRQILFGMHALHVHRIMHRDIKLANILMKNNKFKIGDLGFCKRLAGQNICETILGNNGTKAPEIWKMQSYGIEAEMYSLGIIFYQIVMGCLPFIANKETELLSKITKQEMQFDKVTQELQDLIRKMIKVDPKQRIKFSEIFDHQFFQNNENESSFMNSSHLGIDEIKKKEEDYKISYQQILQNMMPVSILEEEENIEDEEETFQDIDFDKIKENSLVRVLFDNNSNENSNNNNFDYNNNNSNLSLSGYNQMQSSQNLLPNNNNNNNNNNLNMKNQLNMNQQQNPPLYSNLKNMNSDINLNNNNYNKYMNPNHNIHNNNFNPYPQQQQQQFPNQMQQYNNQQNTGLKQNTGYVNNPFVPHNFQIPQYAGANNAVQNNAGQIPIYQQNPFMQQQFYPQQQQQQQQQQQIQPLQQPNQQQPQLQQQQKNQLPNQQQPQQMNIPFNPQVKQEFPQVKQVSQPQSFEQPQFPQKMNNPLLPQLKQEFPQVKQVSQPYNFQNNKTNSSQQKFNSRQPTHQSQKSILNVVDEKVKQEALKQSEIDKSTQDELNRQKKEIVDIQQTYNFIFAALKSLTYLDQDCHFNKVKFITYLSGTSYILIHKCTEMSEEICNQIQSQKYNLLRQKDPETYQKYLTKLQNDKNEMLMYDFLAKEQYAATKKTFYPKFNEFINEYIIKKSIQFKSVYNDKLRTILIDTLIDISSNEKIQFKNSQPRDKIDQLILDSCKYLTLAIYAGDEYVDIKELEKNLEVNTFKTVKQELKKLIAEVPTDIKILDVEQNYEHQKVIENYDIDIDGLDKEQKQEVTNLTKLFTTDRRKEFPLKNQFEKRFQKVR